MAVEACAFTTERLVVDDWHRLDPARLRSFVVETLTPAVTQALPPDWSGSYDDARARRWISERDAEGTTRLVSEGTAPVGLVLLSEVPAPGGVQVRIGYLLSEHAWGRGLGGELLAGLVRWCRSQPEIRSLIGGVDAGNAASIRVLERSGFVPADAPGGAAELLYRLDL